jgi:hypothetical protein
MDPGRPEVRRAVRVRGHLLTQRFVLATSDVGEAASFRPQGGVAIEVDREVEASRDLLAEAARQVDALSDGGGPERHEGDDVHCADAWVRASVALHVDQLERAADAGSRRADHRLGTARERHDAAVVGLVSRVVEQRDAFDLADGPHDLVDHLGAATLAEVRYALDQARHADDRSVCGHCPTEPASDACYARPDDARPSID